MYNACGTPMSSFPLLWPAAGNACGTIGILHAVANLSTYTGGEVALAPDSFFDKFVKATLEATPEERAEALEKDDSIDESHAAVAQQGQSEVVDDTYNHFIAFVAKGGHLYEMDGRKEFPINHGPTSEETLLEVRARLRRTAAVAAGGAAAAASQHSRVASAPPNSCSPALSRSLPRALQDSVKVVQAYMDRDPGELRFTMVALAPPAPAEEE
jgi:hypothetical protein